MGVSILWKSVQKYIFTSLQHFINKWLIYLISKKLPFYYVKVIRISIQAVFRLKINYQMASNFTLFSMCWITVSIYRRNFSCKFLPYQKKKLAEESNTSKRYSFVCEIERVITLSCAISSLWWIISLDKGLNQLLFLLSTLYVYFRQYNWVIS